MITTAAESDNQNVTPVNDTIIEPVKEVIEAPAPIEEEITEEELTPEELMEIREGEKAEEKALTTDEEDEPEDQEEDIIEPVESSIPDTIETTTEDIIEPVQVADKEIFIQEEVNEPVKKEVVKTSLKRTVNKSGFIFVGTEYAGDEVLISF